MSFLVAIVGRPNVGKSTLFNRLVGFNRAIVGDQPGVTRDRNYALAELGGRRVTLVDTGGFEPSEKKGLMAQIKEQTLLALDEADLTVLLTDGRQGLAPQDRELVDLLRRSGRPFVLAVNKIDGPKQEALLAEFYELGLDPVLPLSAAHGYGLGAFMDHVLGLLPPEAEEEPAHQDRVRVAV
ncbi:MAG: GTPase, partial [Pseudomonadota bacterium]